jgi:hypothetical protein
MSAPPVAPDLADELEPGAVERIIDAPALAVLATAHDRGCPCWACIRAFDDEVTAWRASLRRSAA